MVCPVEGPRRQGENRGEVLLGNKGDVKPIGGGIAELRVHHGAGYRIYFVERGASLVVLLCGGDKATQGRDIPRARELARELKEQGL